MKILLMMGCRARKKNIFFSLQRHKAQIAGCVVGKGWGMMDGVYKLKIC